MYSSILFFEFTFNLWQKARFSGLVPNFLIDFRKIERAKKFAREGAHTTDLVELIGEIAARSSEQASRAFQKISLGRLDPES